MKRPLSRRALFSTLEARCMLSLSPSPYEQYMLELINRARANPSAEATRLGLSNLNEGVTGTKITTTAKQPLVMNDQLVEAIRNHVSWLLANDKFQHEGSGGSTPTSRISASGYSLTGSYGTAENLGLTLTTTLGDLAERTRTVYENLFKDSDVSGRGHRMNLLNGSMKDVGVGLVTGDNYTYSGHDWTAVIGGQDFAYRPGNSFITGVVYQDKITPDKFYSPGEGLANYTVTAVSGTGQQYTITTGVTGGYAIQVPPGVYTVTAASNIGGQGTAQYRAIILGTENVKRDFEFAQFSQTNPTVPSSFAAVTGGTLVVTGTSDSEEISVQRDREGRINVQVGSIQISFDSDTVQHISVDAGDGDDYVLVGEDMPSATIVGGLGSDTLVGTASADVINGGDGDDSISAGGGNDTVNAGVGDDTVNGEGGRDLVHGDDGDDRLNGAGGNDTVFGDGGNDRVYGGSGDDRLDGGGNVDRVYGNEGNDIMIGGSSNDRLYGNEGDDEMWGGKGKDYFDGGPGTNRVKDRELLEVLVDALG